MEIKKILEPVKKLKNVERYYLKDEKDYHCAVGIIKADDIKSAGFGGIVKTNTDKEFYVLPATFIDKFDNIKRSAQIITRKDAAAIIAETGIGKDSVVVEAGTGSGGLTAMLANIAKEVYSYDVVPENVDLGRKNAESLGIKNVTFEVLDLKQNSPNKDVDVVVLDMPQAEEAIGSAFSMLKVGGFLVGYFPQITQAQTFILALKDDFVVEKAFETIQRDWVITEKIVRPEFQIMGHTAFLVIARKARK